MPICRRNNMPDLNVVFCWHMHQPIYREMESGQYLLPWTYLHAIKDYSDMAAIIQQEPEARAVVNFAPVLLEQIADYASNLNQHLANGTAIRDPLLAQLASDTAATVPARLQLIRQCLRAHEQHQIERNPAFQNLVKIARFLLANPAAVSYLEGQFFADLVTWYHLAWLGESIRRHNTDVHRLMDKGCGYDAGDRRTLLAVIANTLNKLIPSYRQLADHGQIELSFSPYAHPMLPMLVDGGGNPAAELYGDHWERAQWHMEHGIRLFRDCFMQEPSGCWPSEGGISMATMKLLDHYNLRWCASGDSVLHHSLPDSANALKIYRPENCRLCCFFRHTELSDLIGFEYSRWQPKLAVRDFIQRLEHIQSALPEGEEATLSIIMDGENAWGYYPENGYGFLQGLYQSVAAHPRLHLTTFSHALDQQPVHRPLPTINPGSWVYGNFDKWTNNAAKMKSWHWLAAAAEEVSKRLPSLTAEQRLRVEEQWAICEGSDWFWWAGESEGEAVSQFDVLFRHHLASLYRMAGAEVPAEMRDLVMPEDAAEEVSGAMVQNIHATAAPP